MLETLFNDVLLPAILTTAGLLFTYLLALGQTYLKSKTQLLQNEALRETLMTAEDVAFKAAQEVQRRAVADLKRYSADGKLTKDEAEAAAKTAAKLMLEMLGTEGKKALVRHAGTPEKALETILKPALEGAVGRVKAQHPVVREMQEGFTLRDFKAVQKARGELGL